MFLLYTPGVCALMLLTLSLIMSNTMLYLVSNFNSKAHIVPSSDQFIYFSITKADIHPIIQAVYPRSFPKSILICSFLLVFTKACSIGNPAMYYPSKSTFMMSRHFTIQVKYSKIVPKAVYCFAIVP